MRKPEIIAIAALGKDTRYICSADGELLWHNPVDLQRVKNITLTYPLIMGRKTHESIGVPLPNRENIVLTRDVNYTAPGCKIAHTVDEALEIAMETKEGKEKIFIFGGSEIYDLFLDKTDKLMLTLYKSQKHGDRMFPAFEHKFIKYKNQGGGTFDGEEYEWIDYERKRS